MTDGQAGDATAPERAEVALRAVAHRVVELVQPRSVLVVGAASAGWVEAFAALGGVRVGFAVEPAAATALPGRAPPPAPVEPVIVDVRDLAGIEPVDLAVSTGVGERLTTHDAPSYVAALCAVAPVVLFAAAPPGLAPPGSLNPRWAHWWDGLFEAQGFTVHDVVRASVWDDARIEVALRQGLVLYVAERSRAAPASPLPRSAVHEDAYRHALSRSVEPVRARLAEANGRLVRLEAEVERQAQALASAGERLERARTALDRIDELERALTTTRAELDERDREAARLRAAWTASEQEAAAARAMGSAEAHERGAAGLVRRATRSLPAERLLPVVLGPPARLFDEAYYVERYPDVATARVSPLWHYRRHGTRQRRSPHPLFDAGWYARQAGPALGEGDDAVAHYLEIGWRQGFDPHPLFSTRWYLETNPDVARSGDQPLLHYLERGGFEGRSPHPLIDVEWFRSRYDVADTGDVALAEHVRRRAWRHGQDPNPLFDTAWYLQRNPDVVAAGVPPLEHYASTGWREGRDPHPLFSVQWYLERYPDVAAAGAEPLAHFLRVGGAERRSPGPRFDTEWYVAQHPDAVADGGVPVLFYLRVGAPRGDATAPG